MSSRRGGGSGSGSGSKGKNVADVDSLTRASADLKLDDGDDPWKEVVTRKSKPSKPAASGPKQWPNSNSNAKVWGAGRGAQQNPANAASAGVDPRRPAAGRGNTNYRPPAIAPPLENGWNWQSRPAARRPPPVNHVDKDKGVDEDDDNNDGVDADLDDDSEDELLSDEFDSDSSAKSHNTLKNSRWFRKLFKTIDELKFDEVNDLERQWHCPACQNGPGAIDWYRGLQPLMTHAKTKGGSRLKQHRMLAELLDEELRRKGSSVVPPGETFGRWKGVQEEEKDYEIVWPPMVMIMNTRLELDDNEKWIGMGNPELLDYFSAYTPTKSRHAYGPQGHRGMSLLIFEASARGYIEAERLHAHFQQDCKDRNAWIRVRNLFSHGGLRQLYGYLATKEDLESFNQHSQGKAKLKFELKSHREMVLNRIKQMSEDNQQLYFYKDKLVKEKMHSKTVEKSLGVANEKLRRTGEENRIVRQLTKLQHKENKEEMYSQEEFFQKQIKIIHETREEKEESFERLQQKEREMFKSSTNTSDAHKRSEEISKFIEAQDRDMEEYMAKWESLIKAHEENLAAVRQRQREELVELENKHDAEVASLREKYNPKTQC